MTALAAARGFTPRARCAHKRGAAMAFVVVGRMWPSNEHGGLGEGPYLDFSALLLLRLLLPCRRPLTQYSTVVWIAE